MDRNRICRTTDSGVSFDVFALEKRKKYRLIREGNYLYEVIDRIPISSKIPGVKKKVNKTGIKMNESKIINRYIRTMENAGFDLSPLYNRFKNTRIDFRNAGLTGTYDLDGDRLLVDVDDVENSLIRALFDMTMTRVYPHFVTRGFESVSTISDKNGKSEISHIGFGLYESYKELLLARFFEVPVQEKELCDLARLTEIAVGEERMKRLFEKGDIGRFVKKIDRNTVFFMDVLYQRICKWGKIGSKSATRIFSRVLRTLAERAISQIRRDADDAIVQRWDFAEGEWQSTIYESDLDRAERELMEVKRIVASYQKREAFKIGLTEEDETRIKRTLDNAKVQDSGSLINLAGPVKRLRGVSNRKR